MESKSFLNRIMIDSEIGICRVVGKAFPIVGFGTYRLKGEEGTQAIRKAIDAGYRVLDTATYYHNFKEIAYALKERNREDFYLISKVWHDQQSPPNLLRDFERALYELETDYLDAYFLHWPNSAVPIEESLGAMQSLRQSGKLRHIGLSNVTVNHMLRAMEVGVSIEWVQVEMNPNFFDPSLIAFCTERSIATQAWAPLGRGSVSNDPLLSKMSLKYGKTASQVALRWIIQHGTLPLPSSKSELHLKENLDVIDFSLTGQEMDELDARAKVGKRKRVSKEVQGLDDEFDYSYEECWPSK